MKLAVISSILLFFIFVFLSITKLVYSKDKNSMEKNNQFECGFNSMAPSRMPFSFQFFLVSILFLIFDIEIALVMSFPIESKNLTSTFMIVTFLFILTGGLLMEWKKGKIEWSKWTG